MPYNYLIDEKIRENYEINLENSVLIFDEAHNITQAQEEVTSFELRAKMLDLCLTELHSLQESRSQNDQKEWKAKEDDIAKLKQLTNSFMKFLNNYNLNTVDHPHAVDVRESKYLPPRSLVLSGSQIFSIFFEGTNYTDTTKEGKMIRCDVRSDWVDI